MSDTISATPTRSTQIHRDTVEPSGVRALLSGLSLVQALTLLGTGVLVLLGVLLGGRAYVAAVDPTNLVTHSSTIEAASATAELREPATRSRES